MSTISKQNQGRVFEVVSGSVGPWNQGGAFNEFEFRRLHPVPDAGENTPDPEAYWESLLQRLVGIKCIKEAPGRIADPTPEGPLANPRPAYRNPMAEQMERCIDSRLTKLVDVVEGLVESGKSQAVKAR